MPEPKSPKKAEEPRTSSAATPLSKDTAKDAAKAAAKGAPATSTSSVSPGKAKKKPTPVKVPKPQTSGNPRWLVPTMLTLFIVGVLWVVTFYLTSSGLRLPIPVLGQWNIAAGFALILAGFGLATRWK